jgi:hypothetical protein
LQQVYANHWWAAQWLLFGCDEKMGSLAARGFNRCVSQGSRVRLVQGDGFGTIWQKGALCLAPWGSWVEQSQERALVYVAGDDAFYELARWPAEPYAIDPESRLCEHCALLGLEEFAVAYELGGNPGPERLELVQSLVRSGLLSEEAMRAWMMRIGYHLLRRQDWHHDPGSAFAPREH